MLRIDRTRLIVNDFSNAVIKKMAFSVALAGAVIVYFLLFAVKAKETKTHVYVIDRNNNTDPNIINKSSEAQRLHPYITEAIDFKSRPFEGEKSIQLEVDDTTLDFFKSLEMMFSESRDIGDHFEKIKKYLYSTYPNDEAKILFDIYQSYLLCEHDIAENMDISSLYSSDSMEVVEALAELQEHRRSWMGREIADALFNSKVKVSEYAIRKNSIVKDDTLYGLEKEEALRSLNEEIWCNETGDANKPSCAFVMYQEKKALYKKDIEEFDSDEDRKMMIKVFREEFFTLEAIDRIEAREQAREDEEKRETVYYEREKHVQSSTELSMKEKAEEINALQDEIFGKDADVFRARLNLKNSVKMLPP